MKLRYRPIRLTCRTPFATATGTTAARDSVLVAVEQDGCVGLGEAAPVRMYGQSCASVIASLPAAAKILAAADPFASEKMADQLLAALPGQFAAVAAIDMAVFDLAGKLANQPTWRRLGVSADNMPRTTFSIGIDSIERTGEKVREAAGWPVLKIKLGTEYDEAIIDAVRAATGVPLRVDANGGWSLARARQMCRWLAERNVDLVEQPLPRGQEDDLRMLAAESPLPIFADESCHTAADAIGLAGCVHGVNLKLSKAGGIMASLRLIHAARAAGLKVMIGCMIESSIGIAAAAQLAPLCDVVDLDGHLLLADDPAGGLACRDGKLVLSNRPGLGVELKAELGDPRGWQSA